MADNKSYIDYVTSTHPLYERYHDDWKLAVKSYWGGVEYRDGEYLKAYEIDYSTASDTINTYDIDDFGSTTAVYRSSVQPVNTAAEADSGTQYPSNFYYEKLQNVPVLPYTRLYASEYNAILFRQPPVRELPEDSDVERFIRNVDGEGNSINEFMSQVDVYTTVYGVVWVSCVKPAGSPYPRWRWHSPLDVTNWTYGYDHMGELELKKICIRVASEPEVEIFQVYTQDSIETVFVPRDGDVDLDLPDGAEYVEDDEDSEKGVYRIQQPNELGYIPVTPIYQSNKVYNGIGHTPIFDISQMQRSIYGDFGEIYSAVTYGAHPVTVADETTIKLNDNNIGAEPGATIRVPDSLNGQPNWTFEFRAPPLDSIKELRELIEQKIEKMNQIAMVRSEELIKASRSGVQIEHYDSKLEAFIRKKATSLENAEGNKLWPIWFDWQGVAQPEDLSVSYNRLYSQKGLENEIKEMRHLMEAYRAYQETFGEITEMPETDRYTTPEQAEARAVELGGTGIHEHEEDGVTYYMPFQTHAEYEMRLAIVQGLHVGEAELSEELSEKIRERLMQLIDSSYSENSL